MTNKWAVAKSEITLMDQEPLTFSSCWPQKSAIMPKLMLLRVKSDRALNWKPQIWAELLSHIMDWHLPTFQGHGKSEMRGICGFEKCFVNCQLIHKYEVLSLSSPSSSSPSPPPPPSSSPTLHHSEAQVTFYYILVNVEKTMICAVKFSRYKKRFQNGVTEDRIKN